MRQSHRVVPAGEVTWDDTYDVVVVGAGAAGFPAALHASARGSSAVILEKASEPGGTMKKSAAWYWIPNNTDMQREGLVDAKERASLIARMEPASMASELRLRQYQGDEERRGEK